MRVAELWRYPVKSLGGERVTSVAVDERGVAGDRIWALTDTEGGIASGKTTRRFRALPGLMRHRSHLDGDEPVITLTDGRSARACSPELDAVVAAISPPGWALQREASIRHFDAGAVHVVTTATLATLSAAAGEPVGVERLRPNILLDTGHDAPFPEGSGSAAPCASATWNCPSWNAPCVASWWATAKPGSNRGRSCSRRSAAPTRRAPASTP